MTVSSVAVRPDGDSGRRRNAPTTSRFVRVTILVLGFTLLSGICFDLLHHDHECDMDCGICRAHGDSAQTLVDPAPLQELDTSHAHSPPAPASKHLAGVSADVRARGPPSLP